MGCKDVGRYGMDGCDCMCPLKSSNGVVSAYSHSLMKYNS